MAKAKAKVAKSKTAKKCSCEGMEPLVVASKVKAYVKSKGMMSASDMIGGLTVAKSIVCLMPQSKEPSLTREAPSSLKTCKVWFRASR